MPYTGCNPRGLVLARDKALAKKVLTYHRVPVPKFDVVHSGRRARRAKPLTFPLIVKSLTEEASVGIAQASVVWDDDRARRAREVHPRQHRRRRAHRGVHRRARDLRRRAGQQAPDRAAAVGAVLREHGARCGGDRDRAGEAQPRVPEEARDHGGRGGARSARALASDVDGEADLSQPLARRLRATGLPAARRRDGVLHRGESESRDRAEGGVRAVGAQGGDQVRAVDRDDPVKLGVRRGTM